MSDQLIPTLVIGVGGIGCKIAEGIFREGQAHGFIESGQLAVVGFDTDLNDVQSRARASGKRRFVQFSTSEPVRNILRASPEIEGVWFPPMSELSEDLKNMSLIEGAGQVRILTRLALHDAVRRNQVDNDIQRALGDLATFNNRDAWQGAVNIYMVGSLAGATGCGSFIQIALIAKNAARLRSVNRASVRGLFLLPDVVVRAAGLAADQEQNVIINGAAALRELNAAMQIANGHHKKGEFQFEYLPGHDLEAGGAPFDVMTFLDYETTGGQSLGRDLEYYLSLARRTALIQLFSPIGQDMGQRTVNSVQQRLQFASLGASNSYASVGVYTVAYPQAAWTICRTGMR